MKIINLAEEGVEAAARSAAAILRGGGVVLYPTDTLYGLGADAFSSEAVAKIYVIKGRDEKKPIHCVVPDMQTAEKCAEVNESAKKLAASLWPGALTLVLKKKQNIEGGIAKEIDTIGMRIPQNEFCLALAREFGAPYTTTSANRAGMETSSTTDGILEQFGAGADQIDLVIDAGELSTSKPSTVVDVSGGKPQILREGTIPATEIHEVLGKVAPRSRL